MLKSPPWFAAEGYTYSSTAVVLQYCTVVLYCCLQQQQTGAGYHTRFEKWGARYLWSAVPLPFGPLQYAPFLFVAAVYTSMARSYSYCHLGTEHLFLWSISYFSKSLRLNFITASFLSGGASCTSGRQYNIGEKPSVALYTYINLHAGTPKPHSFLSKSPALQCSNMVLYGLREIKVKLNLY